MFFTGNRPTYEELYFHVAHTLSASNPFLNYPWIRRHSHSHCRGICWPILVLKVHSFRKSPQHFVISQVRFSKPGNKSKLSRPSSDNLPSDNSDSLKRSLISYETVTRTDHIIIDIIVHNHYYIYI